MNNVLLIEPYEFLNDKYRNDPRILIYSEKSIACWSNGERKTTNINYPASVTGDFDVSEIQKKIQWAVPLWFRWMGDAGAYLNYQQTCLMFVMDLAQALVDRGVSHAVFFTGVAHHIEYSLIESACQIADIRQVFLYPMPFCGNPGRLLPVVQRKTITDRQMLGLQISHGRFRDEIAAYRENHLASKPPKQNDRIDRRATSYRHALSKVGLMAIKKPIRDLVRGRVDAREHPIEQREDHDARSILRLVQRQRSALEYYVARALDDEAVDRLVDRSSVLPIIFAHYQPEASTFPEGGKYCNHIDLVLAIRGAGYDGQILYKEHPGSWIFHSDSFGFSRVGLCRSIEYFKQLEALGCVLVHSKYGLRDARLASLFPVTITGSIALERSMVGLSTCCAGVPWFRGAPGVVGLDETFGEGGVLYDSRRWRFESDSSVDWFDSALSMTTLCNYPGIGTGVRSDREGDKVQFLAEFEELVRQLSGRC